MSQNIWECVNRQKIYDQFDIDSRNVLDWHLITLFGYYTPEIYSIMQQVQRLVLQNRYFLGLVGDYGSLEVPDPKGGSRRETLDEKSLRYLRASELAIFLLLLDKKGLKPSSGPTIEVMDVLRNNLTSKCVFLFEGDIDTHFDTKFIQGHPEYKFVLLKIDEVRSDDIEGISKIIIGKCEALYFHDWKYPTQ
jgi:hypothetical protein